MSTMHLGQRAYLTIAAGFVVAVAERGAFSRSPRKAAADAIRFCAAIAAANTLAVMVRYPDEGGLGIPEMPTVDDVVSAADTTSTDMDLAAVVAAVSELDSAEYNTDDSDTVDSLAAFGRLRGGLLRYLVDVVKASTRGVSVSGWAQ